MQSSAGCEPAAEHVGQARRPRARRASAAHRRDIGQATVELALCLPLVCLLALGVVQVGIIVRDRVAVIAAAREGARAASVAASPATAAARAVGDRGLRPLVVSTSTAGSVVTVTVRYVDHTDVPLIGALLPDVVIESSVSMVLEPP